jgi:hypothetical protein
LAEFTSRRLRLEQVLMPQLTTPVFANENGDLSIYGSLDAMASYVEAIDVENGEYEFFDAAGWRLEATVSANQVTFTLDPAGLLEAERLEEILRGCFSRLPSRLQDFERRAAAARSLSELVVLREELEAARRPSLFRGMFRRPPT